MSTTAKYVLTAAVLTNPLVWLVVALAVMLLSIALGVAVLWVIVRYLRDEWTIPTRPKPVLRRKFLPADPPTPVMADPSRVVADASPPFGVELPRPLRVTAEQRQAILAAERAEPKTLLVEATPALDGHMAHERLVVKGHRQDGVRKPTARPHAVSSASRTTTRKAVSHKEKSKVSGAKKKPRPTKDKVQKA